MNRKIYMAAGFNTLSMGTGRKEFNPRVERPGLEHYISEAGKGVISQIGSAQKIDEVFIGNFMAARFNKQAHLGAFAPMIDPALTYKPSTRVEAACASGGLALMSGIKAVLSGTSETVLALGVEVQNTVKAIYGADILAGAGWFKRRKEGHAYFFPGQFSNRAGAYFEKFGREKTRAAMAVWYKNAIENARLCPTAQEYHNTTQDLEALALTEPNPKNFTEFLNVFDCSKVSDGASAILILSEEGLAKCGIDKKDAIEVVGFGHAVNDLTHEPDDLTKMDTLKVAAEKAMKMAGITVNDLSTIELHDCFTIAGLLALEAIGVVGYGEAADFVKNGNTARNGKLPVNTTGGLIGWGHPTGGTGVHMAVTVWEQLTGKANANQITINPDKPYALSVNMGGDDRTLVSIVYKKV